MVNTTQSLTNITLAEVPTDANIVVQFNRELKEVQGEMEALQEIVGTSAQVVSSHSGKVQECAAKTNEASQALIQAEKKLEAAVEYKNHYYRLKIFSGIGGAAGCAIGAAGFAINPLAGVVSIVALGALGYGVGGLVGGTID